MKKVLIIGMAAVLVALTAACGGGGTSSSDKTATAGASKPAATARPITTVAANVPESPTEKAEASAPAESTGESAELAKDVTTLRTIMQQVIAKAQAGDVQGTKDTEGTMDDPIEAIVKAARAKDAALGDAIEQHELNIEHQADSDAPDLKVIASEAQAVLPLLDQVVTTLNLPVDSASAGTPDTTELAKDVTTLRAIMQQVIAKAQAGDVQGTKDTEGTMDDPIEAIVKAARAADPALGDAIEQHELNIEHQADSDAPDLKVIASEAQAVLPLLDQVVTKLKLSQ
jgi:hypothetical protein